MLFCCVAVYVFSLCSVTPRHNGKTSAHNTPQAVVGPSAVKAGRDQGDPSTAKAGTDHQRAPDNDGLNGYGDTILAKASDIHPSNEESGKESFDCVSRNFHNDVATDKS